MKKMFSVLKIVIILCLFSQFFPLQALASKKNTPLTMDSTFKADDKGIALISGTTRKSAKIKIDGKKISVDKDGAFSYKYKMKNNDKKKKITITATLEKHSKTKKTIYVVPTVTKKQKDILVSFTQLDAEKNGYNVKYGGEESWNVASNPDHRWVVNKKDEQLGKIKAIYKWDGKRDSSATLIYFLISGTEIVNNL